MKKLLLSTVAFAALAAVPAMAADLPARAPIYKAQPPVATTSWTGLYIGGHLGYGYGISTYGFAPTSGTFFGTSPAEFRLDPSGWLGGAQVGLNYQVNTWVLGVEGTWSAADINKTVTSPAFPATDTETTRIRNLYTVTGRLGYLLTPSYLTYVKGGWAGGRVELSAASTAGPTTWTPGAQNRNGWTVGSGFEYMLMPNITLGVEYNFIQFTSARYSAAQVGTAGTTIIDDKTRVHTVVGRLNYLFNFGGNSVMARY